MLRFVIAILLCFTSVAAASDRPADYISRDATRQAIYDRDFKTVEATYAAAQIMFTSGRVEAGSIRFLFDLFETTHPDVIRFSKNWVEKMPDSAYAHAARARVLTNGGWIIRGDGYANEIYPDALQEFRVMHRQAWEHAVAAYEFNPRLIEASDAVITLGNSNRGRMTAFKVLNEVMQSDPNMGTLRRGLFLTNPGWGGTLRQADRMCDTFGAKITYHMDPVLFCKVYAGVQYHPKQRGEWAQKMIWETPIPELTHLTLNFATHSSATREQAQIAYDHLTDPDVTDIKYADRYDMNLAVKYDMEFISEGVIRRAQKKAAAALKHDPFNPELLDVMQKWVTRWDVDEQGKRRNRVIERPSHEDEIDYARRRLIVQPYVAKHWIKYYKVKYAPMGAAGIAPSEPYRINAIYYSQDWLSAVAADLFNKFMQLDAVQRAEEGSVKDPEWRNAADVVDADNDLICPMVRAYRVVDYLCIDFDPETHPSPFCGMDIAERANYNIVLADAEDRGICKSEFITPVEQMLYTPVPVDLNEAEF